jgi:tetratricopeptide (TPR) repeat protein
MCQFLGSAWRKAREHIGLWLIGWLLGGAVFLATGAGPEEWYRKLFEELHVSGYVSSFWPAGWDIRLVPIIIGMLMIAGGVLWYYHRRHRAVEAPAQPAPPGPPPVTVTVNINGRMATATAHEPTAHPGDKPITLPYPSLGPLFKGRDAFLRRLHESLTRADGTATAIVSQALYGLGGVGKTRAAVEYAWAHRADYAALLFVQADSPEALRRNLAALTGPLALPAHDATDEQVRLHAVLAWLRATPNWLLILDNVDTATALDEAERLMGQLAGGHVLLTSRLDRFAPHVQPLELDVLAPEDAVAFLLERTPRRRHAADDATEARVVAEELGRLALALEQAGATIQQRRCGFAEYLALWRGSREKVLGWARPEITGYPRAVAATWQTSVAQLTEAGRGLLERLAWLAPDPVPEFLLEVPIAGETADQREALLDLAAYSLVTRDPEREWFAMHRLVQDATRRSLDAAAARQRLGEALGWVNDAFAGDPDDVRSWLLLDPLAPHALTVAQHADTVGIAEPTTRLMNDLGALFYTKALHSQAEPLMRRALAITEASLGKDHPAVAVRLNNLAQLLQATNRLAEAEPLIRRALAIDEASLGKDHPNVAIRLNNLAQLLQATNRLDEAEPLMRRALVIDEASFGKDHPKVAIRLNNLAQLLQATNRFAEAEPLMRRALAIDEASFGKDHPKVAIRLNNLAALLRATNRLDEAEPLMRRHVVIFLDFQRTTGHPHPHRDAALRNYANLLRAMGKSEAEIRAAIATLTGTAS